MTWRDEQQAEQNMATATLWAAVARIKTISDPRGTPRDAREALNAVYQEACRALGHSQ